MTTKPLERRLVVAVLNAAIDYHQQQGHEGSGPKGCEWMVCDGASLLWAEFEEQEAKENTDNDQDKDN